MEVDNKDIETINRVKEYIRRVPCLYCKDKILKIPDEFLLNFDEGFSQTSCEEDKTGTKYLLNAIKQVTSVSYSSADWYIYKMLSRSSNFQNAIKNNVIAMLICIKTCKQSYMLLSDLGIAVDTLLNMCEKLFSEPDIDNDVYEVYLNNIGNVFSKDRAKIILNMILMNPVSKAVNLMGEMEKYKLICKCFHTLEYDYLSFLLKITHYPQTALEYFQKLPLTDDVKYMLQLHIVISGVRHGNYDVAKFYHDHSNAPTECDPFVKNYLTIAINNGYSNINNILELITVECLQSIVKTINNVPNDISEFLNYYDKVYSLLSRLSSVK